MTYFGLTQGLPALTINGLRKDLDVLPRDARAQVEGGLRRYAMSGQGDGMALRGRAGYRLRIGSTRVIFDEDQITVLAIYIGKRETTTYRRV